MKKDGVKDGISNIYNRNRFLKRQKSLYPKAIRGTMSFHV